MFGPPEHRLALASLVLLTATLAAPPVGAASASLARAGIDDGLTRTSAWSSHDGVPRPDEAPGTPIEEIETRDGDDASSSDDLVHGFVPPVTRLRLVREAPEPRPAASEHRTAPRKLALELAARGPPAR